MIALSMCIGLAVVLADEPKEDDKSTLTRWSSDEPMVGVFDELTTQGVSIKIDQEIIPIVIPWFDVRDLHPSALGYAKYQQFAQDSWRAHTRLARGDYFGAESIYNALEDEYLWTVGAQGADVSMGLVRCRLDRGDRVHAVVPFLSWLGASQSTRSANTGNNARHIEGFDSKYELFVDLVPVFGPGDRGLAIGNDGESARIIGRQHVLYAYYTLALDHQSHRTPQAELALKEIQASVRELGKRDAGLALIDEIVIAQAHPDSEKRTSARKSLQRRVRANDGTWIELWARLALGSSMIAEQDTELNEQGVIELIHIVVRLGHLSQPSAELAAQIANEYFIRTNRTQWGNEILLEAQAGWSND